MTGQSYPVPPNSLTGDGSDTLGVTYQYDSMARLTTMLFGAQTTTAAYGPAGELTSLYTVGAWGYVQETRTYNSLLQLTQIQSTSNPNNWNQNIQYVYSATQNNGRITQTIDAVSGEQVSYQYDALNRLMHAETAGNTWGETYQYDGFGNLTVKTPTKGSAPAWSATYNSATNWQMGVQYDANGNPPAGTFDVENRLVSEIDPSTGDTVSWLYDPWGKRVGRQDQTTQSSQFTLYGLTGQSLAVLGCTSNGQWSTCAMSNSNVYFEGRLLMKAVGGYMPADRLGSVGTGSAYFPYGEEKGNPPTPTGIERFGTYYRDFVGQDYADQRYYNSIGGRFLTPDPLFMSAADKKDPGSWNRYAYAGGDPVNRNDPAGLDWVNDGGLWELPTNASMSCMGGPTAAAFPAEIAGWACLVPPMIAVAVAASTPPIPTCGQVLGGNGILPTGTTGAALTSLLLGENSWSKIGTNQYLNGDSLGLPTGLQITVATVSLEDDLILDVAANLANARHVTLATEAGSSAFSGYTQGTVDYKSYLMSPFGSNDCYDLTEVSLAVQSFFAGGSVARTSYNQFRAVVQLGATRPRHQGRGDYRVGGTDFYTIRNP